MVVIGFDKKYTIDDVSDCLQKHKITICGKPFCVNDSLENIYFYEVETENLTDEWFCCWGGIYQLNLSREELHTDIHRIEYLKKRIQLFDNDISFWLDFSNDFVNQFGTIALFRYYPDLTLPITIEEIKPTEFTQEKLLGMECNHIFLISNKH